MRKVCAWCKKPLDDKQGPLRDNEPISHGICQKCAFHVKASSNGVPLKSFLEQFNAPVLCISREATVVTLNEKASRMLQKDLSQVFGKKGGMVFECEYAYLPEGCGRTVHCSGCTIRKSVMDTFETGQSHEKVPALWNHRIEGKIGFLISTEKVGECILLRIDDVDK